MAPSWISTSKVCARRLEAEEMSDEQEMAGRGDRQELGQPLDDAEKEGLDQMHHGGFRAWPKRGSAGRF